MKRKNFVLHTHLHLDTLFLFTFPTSAVSFLLSFVTRVYVPRFFVSSQQRFGATDIKALGVSQLSGLGQTVLQLLDKSVLQLHLIQKKAGESILEAGEHATPKTEESGGARQRAGEREPFGSSFCMSPPPPPPAGPSLCKQGQAGGPFVLPEVPTRPSDLPLSFLCSPFVGFPCLSATTVWDSCFLLYLPIKRDQQSALLLHAACLFQLT